MGIAKAQKIKIAKTCKCGCGEIFYPFPTYGKKGEGLRYPEYKRGHHPNTRKTQTGNKPVWNKGLTKEDHPSIKKIGFQPGHEPFNDWSHIIDLQRNDVEYREKWIRSKQGQVPWNKGLDKEQYPNGIKSGEDHGNWCGNTRGVNDLAIMKELKKVVRKRDKQTCQECGHNNQTAGFYIPLEVHHIISIAENIDLALDTKNMITLCRNCHRETDNYGTKAVKKAKCQGG